MNIPLTLYDYLALFVPGILILVGLAPQFQVGSSDLQSVGSLEVVVLAVIAFVLGHFNQWLTKAILVALGQFMPAFYNAGAYLLRNPYPNPPPKEPPNVWKRLTGAFKTLFPFYWSMQRFSKERATRILGSLERYYGYPIRPEEAVGRVLSALDNGDRKQILTRREQFQAQADFLRGTATSLVILAVCVWKWGLPDFFALKGSTGTPRMYVVLLLVVMAGSFVKRHLQYEFNMASMLFSAFENAYRSQDSVKGDGPKTTSGD